MQRSLIISIIAAVLLVVFAIQNVEPINVRLYLWDVSLSRALLLLVTFGIGVILGALFSIPTMNRKNKIIREKDKLLHEKNKIIEELNRTIDKLYPGQEGKQGPGKQEDNV
ncbi:MAG: LapA family protein [bacterium]